MKIPIQTSSIVRTSFVSSIYKVRQQLVPQQFGFIAGRPGPQEVKCESCEKCDDSGCTGCKNCEFGFKTPNPFL